MNAAAGAAFSPMQAEWIGRWGCGSYLEGAEIHVETDRPGLVPAECLFSTRTSYQVVS
jgi:hypothetical protein